MAQYAQITDLTSMSITPEMAQNFSDASMNAALISSSDKINSYLRSQQILPLTAWDDQLTQITCDLAAYKLFSQYGFNPDATQNMVLKDRYQEAIKWLEQVASQMIIVEYPDSDSSFFKAGPFVRNSNSPVGFARICYSNNGITKWRW